MQAILNDTSCAVELLTQLDTKLMDRPPLSARWRYLSSKIIFFLVINLKWPILLWGRL